MTISRSGANYVVCKVKVNLTTQAQEDTRNTTRELTETILSERQKYQQYPVTSRE